MAELIDAGADREGAVAAAVTALKGGRLAVLPTDTVYGVAADAFNPAATTELFRVKHRSRMLPLPVLIRSPKQLLGLVTQVSDEAERLMAAYWPGPLTMIVNHDPNLSWDLGRAEGTVAVRMPFDEVTLDVIRAVGPIACTSANLSGSQPAPTAAGARQQLGEDVAVYLDAGRRQGLAASTIIDLTRGRPQVLREGPIPAQEAVEVATGARDLMDVTVVQPPVTAQAPSLQGIAGLGPARQAALLEAFGSVEAVAGASTADLVEVSGIGPALAERIRAALK